MQGNAGIGKINMRIEKVQYASVQSTKTNSESTVEHNLVVVVGAPSNRKRQEVALFQECPHFRTMLVFSSTEKPWTTDGADHAYSELVKLLPDFVSRVAVRKPYSPVSLVKLSNLEKCLEDFAVINCIELYSFISRQCAKVAHEKGKKLAVSVFETIPSSPLHKVPPFSQNVKEVLRQADTFIAYSRRSGDYLRQLVVSEEKIKIIYPGVDLEKFHPPKEHTRSNIRILFVGGFAGEKGLDVLLKAFSRLHVDVPQTELWICAEPRSKRQKALIQTYTRKYPVKAFGFLNHDEMPDIYRECDIFCLPSFDKKMLGVKVWEEQFGFALVEAMASGLPIVATDCGVVPEIVGNDNPIVPQKSVGALYQALLALSNDEKYGKYLGIVNRAKATRLFDIKKQRLEMDKVLFELL